MAPGFEMGVDVDEENFSLLPIEVDSWNSLVFACIDQSVEPLLQWLGDITQVAAQYPEISSFTISSDQTKSVRRKLEKLQR